MRSTAFMFAAAGSDSIPRPTNAMSAYIHVQYLCSYIPSNHGNKTYLCIVYYIAN